MPTVREIVENQSPDEQSSLQVSSTTSPETNVVAVGRALHVKKTGSHSTISSRSSSSSAPVQTPQPVRTKTKKGKDGPSSRSSSAHSIPPKMPSQGSHRGVGAIVPSASSVAILQDHNAPVSEPSDQEMEGSQHVFVQNNQQNLYDQRSIHLQVGVDPSHVVQHVQAVESQAHSVIHDAVTHVHETQRRAESVVRETQVQAQRAVDDAQREARSVQLHAHSHVSAVEDKANMLIHEMQSRHHAELTRAQDLANQAQYQAQERLLESDAKMQNLMAVVESQNQALENQRVRNEELSAQVAALQSEVVMLRHSSVPVASSQDQNGTVNQEELRIVIDSLRREIRQSQNPSVPIQLPVPQRMYIATPPHDVQSACAGFPPVHQGPPSPVKGPRSVHTSTATPPFVPPGRPPSGSSSSSTEGHGPGGFPGGWPVGPPSDPGGSGDSPYSPHPSYHSIGVGSASLSSEESVYRYKALQSVKVDSLPQDAASYRGWKNGLVTKLCSIDITGRDIILQWVLESLDPTADLNVSQCMFMPRLDAYMAAILTEQKHLKGDLGVQFQAYVEQCQQHRVSPKGRFMLQLIARRFQLDLNRGANLTQQSLLELTLDSYSGEALAKFIERIELVLNSIPPSHQPSEMTKFTWLFSRLKHCRAMQRFIDRVKDARDGSHVKTWDWLYGKLKTIVYELREDANEEAVRRAISPEKPKPRPKGDGKGKAAVAKGEQGTDDQATQSAMPNPTAKSKAKPKTGSPKGDGKGKGKGSQDQTKAGPNPKGKPPGGNPPAKAKPKAEPGKPTVKCLFYPNCNRGSSCPFLHEGESKAKAQSKATPAKAPAKAAVATLLASSIRGAEASRTNVSSMGKAFQMFMRPFKAFFASIASLSSLILPETHQTSTVGCLHPFAAPTVVRSAEQACVAAHPSQSGSYDVEWICDSGASRSLASVQSLVSQGIPEYLVQSCLESASTIKFETGNGITNSTECFSFHGSNFGAYEHRILDSCPVARSLGEVVSNGHPFIWMPGELPFFVESVADLQIRCKGRKLVANRIEENVPVFRESVQLSEQSSRAMQSFEIPATHALAAGEQEAAVPSDADSEDAGEEPMTRMQRLVSEAQSPEHLICHFPKNPACPICNRSRMYKKKTQRVRRDPLKERGELEPTTSFGERLATDFIIVQKSASGKENAVQVIRDEHSGWIRAYPVTKRDTPTVVRNLLNFLGPSYDKPCIMVKSDQAREVRLATSQLGFVFEGTLENRHPHNSVLERDIRTLEEVTRACHLQAGFDTIEGLWQHSVDFAATMISAKHVASGRDQTRHMLAVGKEFEGRLLLLGQLVHYRVDPSQREKFEASTRPGLFVGWRYGDGPKSHLGVYLVLDYAKVKGREPGYANSIAVPAEEIFVEDGPAKLPVKHAADEALATFGEAKLEEILPLDIPFSIITPETRAKRNEYITLDRIIKFGPTVGCKACAFSSEHSVHNPMCRARFNALVRADRIASGTKTPGTPAAPTPAAEIAEGLPTAEDIPVDPLDDTEAFREIDADDLPFSAGIPPGSSEAAMVGKVAFVLDETFVTMNKSRNMVRRTSALSGRNVLYEYACSDTSIIGERSADIGIRCIRLSEGVLDLTNPEHVAQAIMQLQSTPGADAWISIPCKYFSPIQRLNEAQYGEKFAKKLKKGRKETRRMLGYALQFAEVCVRNHGRVAFEHPQESGLWDLPEWLEFEHRLGLKRAYCEGCAFGLKGKEGKLLRKPWCISTTDLRLLQFASQNQCDGSHEHGESMGGNAEMTAYYTPSFADMILEAWYPQAWHMHVPKLAGVTKSLTKKEWANDPRALEALKQEAAGLRSNATWDDDTVAPLYQIRNWARSVGAHIKVAELLTLVGIKHHELEPSKWKWKGRIVYRGDQVRDQDNNLLLFDQTATTPTSLIALNAALWYACRKGHTASCSDAIQAFLQSKLDDNDFTFVIIPVELWLEAWRSKFDPTTKLAVRLKKSLYGHPKAGLWWQQHLDRRLKNLGAQEMPMFPSNYLIPWKVGSETATLLLNVYVDDLTLCGDERCHSEFWSTLRQAVKLEPEQYILGHEGTLILGRKHYITVKDDHTKCELDMRPYAESIVDTYCEITGFDKSRFRNVPTPHIPESSITDEDLSQTGELGKDASRILMRLLWLSRLTRPDLSFIVTRLASRVTAWTRFEDRQLHRCIAYLNTSTEVILTGAVAHCGDVRLEVYTDADFAGCVHSAKSTSGLWIEVSSNGHSFPLYWQSKKQSSVARSTTESELIAMANGLFGEVYNLQAFLQNLLGKVVHVQFHQDNSAVLQVLKAGYSAKLRHTGRVHKVNVASISEALLDDTIGADHCATLEMKANGFTKVIAPCDWSMTLKQLSLDYKT